MFLDKLYLEDLLSEQGRTYSVQNFSGSYNHPTKVKKHPLHGHNPKNIGLVGHGISRKGNPVTYGIDWAVADRKGITDIIRKTMPAALDAGYAHQADDRINAWKDAVKTRFPRYYDEIFGGRSPILRTYRDDRMGGMARSEPSIVGDPGQPADKIPEVLTPSIPGSPMPAKPVQMKPTPTAPRVPVKITPPEAPEAPEAPTPKAVQPPKVPKVPVAPRKPVGPSARPSEEDSEEHVGEEPGEEAKDYLDEGGLMQPESVDKEFDRLVESNGWDLYGITNQVIKRSD